MGTSYRSAIYYTSDEQKRVAEDTIADVNASGLWPGKVVTELAPAGDFWEAEPEHQDYLERIPNGYTCHYIRKDWVLPKARISACSIGDWHRRCLSHSSLVRSLASGHDGGNVRESHRSCKFLRYPNRLRHMPPRNPLRPRQIRNRPRHL